jgi:hypothetical protein
MVSVWLLNIGDGSDRLLRLAPSGAPLMWACVALPGILSQRERDNSIVAENEPLSCT